MRWRAHVLIGVFLSFAVLYLFGMRDLAGLALLSAFGGLSAMVPDLDHDSSKGRKILDVLAMLFSLLAVYLWNCGGAVCVPSTARALPTLMLFLALMGGYFVLFLLFKPSHRGITHTILANAVFGLALWVIFGDSIAMAGTVGYFSHLLADMHIKLY